MSRKRKALPILENVTITDIAAEGKSLARVEDMVVFVPLTVPGDIVDLQVRKKKHHYCEAEVIRFIKYSDKRQKPMCEHFGICGGCKWQNLPYEEQLKAKQQQVYDQLVRIGHFEIPEISPIIASDKTRYYRNKLEYTFSSKRWVENKEETDALSEKELCGLGFHVGKYFDKVLDIRHCCLQEEPSNEIRLS